MDAPIFKTLTQLILMKVAKIKDLEPLFALSGLIQSACHPRNFEQARFADTEAFEDHPLAGELFDEEDPEHLAEFYKIVKEHSEDFWLLVLGYDTLLTNCADPNERTLEFKPIFAAAPELRDALSDLIRGYVSVMETGRDRILALGGECDSLEMMESKDPFLKKAKHALAQVKGGSSEH